MSLVSPANCLLGPMNLGARIPTESKRDVKNRMLGPWFALTSSSSHLHQENLSTPYIPFLLPLPLATKKSFDVNRALRIALWLPNLAPEGWGQNSTETRDPQSQEASSRASSEHQAVWICMDCMLQFADKLPHPRSIAKLTKSLWYTISMTSTHYNDTNASESKSNSFTSAHRTKRIQMASGFKNRRPPWYLCEVIDLIVSPIITLSLYLSHSLSLCVMICLSNCNDLFHHLIKVSGLSQKRCSPRPMFLPRLQRKHKKKNVDLKVCK